MYKILDKRLKSYVITEGTVTVSVFGTNQELFYWSVKQRDRKGKIWLGKFHVHYTELSLSAVHICLTFC